MSVPHRNPSSIRQGDQILIRQIKSNTEILKDNLFFINHMLEGLIQAKWYLVQVYMYNSYPVM